MFKFFAVINSDCTDVNVRVMPFFQRLSKRGCATYSAFKAISRFFLILCFPNKMEIFQGSISAIRFVCLLNEMNSAILVSCVNLVHLSISVAC